jgi:hypothetical protein
VERGPADQFDEIDYKLDVLKIVFENGYLGGLGRTNYARFGNKSGHLVLHDPWTLMKLREVSRRSRTWVDELLTCAGLTEAVTRARTVHFRIAKQKLLLVECWDGVVTVVKQLKSAYPIEDHGYVCLGGSPAPIMIAMEYLEPAAQIFHLPLSGIKGGVEHWIKEVVAVWKQYAVAISEHFSRYLPPLGRIRGNKLVIVDYTSTGTALAAGMILVRLYYEALASQATGPLACEPPEVLGFALFTSFNPNPTLLPGTVACNLHKGTLGTALEKQTLKGTGLRGLEKMELSSLKTTSDLVPDTRLDVAGLMRILAQIQRQMKNVETM